MTITYGSYLKVQELLDLQCPASDGPEHDEMLFIIIHQVYELWFKQMRHEGAFLGAALDADDAPTASATLNRMLAIMKTMVAQIDVLETMTPISFLSFRSFLTSSSGFQSWQFRAFEFMLGHKRTNVFERYEPGSPEDRSLREAYAAPSLWTTFLHWLDRNGHAVPAAMLERDVTLPTEANEDVQEALVGLYREQPGQRALCELLVDLDEGVQEWRYRHVKMVERTIGMKQGTGGSPGVKYLQSTLFNPVFPDLWAIRSRL